jgi:hypothetical protein
MDQMLTIELLRADDLSEVVDLVRKQLREHNMECSVDGLRRVLVTIQNEPRYGFTLIAKVQSAIVGFALATMIMSPEHEGLVHG